MAPRLAFLDEPTAGIDMLSLDEVVGVIRCPVTQGRALVLITHEERVAVMVDRATQCCGGRLVCQGAIDRALASYTGRSCLRLEGRACDYD